MKLFHRNDAPKALGRRTLLAGAAAGLGLAALGTRPASAATLDKLRESAVSVATFGAVGDGTTDDTTAITAADAAARSQGRALYFPAGTYRGFGFRPSVSWLGDGDAIVMSNQRVRAAETTRFLRVEDAAGLTFAGMVFDGWVTDDPTSWSAETMHGFHGAVPFILARSHDVTLQDCTFRNAYQSPLRIEECAGVLVDRCRMLRARNPWGDGTYVTGSHDVTYRDCHVSDYTRIGFVADATARGTTDITYLRCIADGGHDASILYGGGEYNAGFWTENSTRTSYRDCTSRDNVHFGFVFASGPEGTTGHRAEGCTAAGSPVGFKASSWAGRPVAVELLSCAAHPGASVAKAPSAGFLFTPRHSADTLVVRDAVSVIGPRSTDPTSVHVRIEALAPAVAASTSLSGATLVSPKDTAAAEVLVAGTYVGAVDLDAVRAVPRGAVRVVVDAPAEPSITTRRTRLADAGH